MSILKKSVSLFLAIVLVIGCVVFLPESSSIAAESYEEMQAERLRLQKEYYDLLKDIDNIADEQARLAKRLDTLRQQITLLEGIISILEDEMKILVGQINQKELELGNKQAQIERTRQTLIERLRAMYMTDTASTLSTVLAANSFFDFLVGSEYLSRISKHDQRLIAQYKQERDDIAAAKQEIELQCAKLDENIAEQETFFADLTESRELVAQAIEERERLAAEAEQALIDTENALLANEEEIAAYCATSTGEYVGGIFKWPVPGYKSVSSPYGNRIHPITGKYTFHSGIDISGYKINKKPVVAAANGTVVLVRYYTTGYGYYVMIDHGGGCVTLYAHLSSISVHIGDVVLSGYEIGKVGSTGASTGPHLHFEIRIAGNTQNPLDLAYLGGVR